MTSAVHTLHVVFAGTWLGCVLTEALFERALLKTGRPNEAILAVLHKRVDVCIEIPAFVGVVATGLFMLGDAARTLALVLKIAVALMAITANVYCVYLVFARHQAARDEDWARFDRLDHRQHQFGAIVLVGILVALGLGLSLG